MGGLRAAEIPPSVVTATVGGAGAVGYGTDVLAEIERLRMSILGLAGVLEEVRTQLNNHTHNATVAALPTAERATTPYIPA